MLPEPLLIVIVIIGIITAILVMDTMRSVFNYLMKRQTKQTTPLSACDETKNVQIVCIV
jgi:hypothetical protein